MWNLCNSCSNAWGNSGCGCGCGVSNQRMCRDCNGNVWVRAADDNGCSQCCYTPYRRCRRCGCNQCANATGANATGTANTANAGFGSCRQNTCNVTATEDGYSYQCNSYCNN